MTEPGWYNAEGDPPGTQRYWDGAQWLGEPVYEPAATPGPAMYPPQPVVPPPAVGAPVPPYPSPAPGGYSYSQPAPSSFPSGLKALAIIVSILKAIPLLLGFVLLVVIAAISNEFDNNNQFGEYDSLLEDLADLAVLIIGIIIVIGAVLIGFQFVGALKERPMMVFIPALIMSILDSLSTLASWAGYFDSRGNSFRNESPGGALLMTAITVAQIAVAVMAIRANNASKP